MGQTLGCEFKNLTFKTGESFYGCYVENKEISEYFIGEFKGKHALGKTSNDVIEVWIANCTVKNIPRGLKLAFPKMTILNITQSKLKTLNKDDLKEYKNLKWFYCVQNLIEHLPGDLFEGFTNLERIIFRENKIRTIEPWILKDLDNLKCVDFGLNSNYDLCYSQYPVHKPNVSLNELKENLIRKYSQNSGETLEHDDQKSRINEANLNQEVKSLRNSEQSLIKDLQILKISEEKLNEEVKKLNNSEAKMTIEIRNLKISEQKLNQEIQKLRNTERNLNQKLQRLKNLEKKLKTENQNLKNSEKKLTEKVLDLSKQVQNVSNKSIFSDLQNHIQNDDFKDFKIDIDGLELHVHKLLLSIRSPFLAEMLRNNPNAENLKLSGIPADVFELVIDFLYNDELPHRDGIDYLKLFAAASRLKVEGLKNLAAMEILIRINAENALEILDFSNKYEHDILRQKAFEEIKRKYPKIEFNDELAKDVEQVSEIIKTFEKLQKLLKPGD